MLIFLQDFFSVSPKEARGIFGLLLLSATALTFPAVLKHTLFARTESEKANERVVLDSLVRIMMQSREQSIRSNKSSEEELPEAVLQRFNPNTASENDLTGVGIPLFLARRIVNFREKGGVFRRKEDLKRIYDFPGELYLTLEPYVTIEEEDPKESRSFGSNTDPRERQPSMARVGKSQFYGTTKLVVPFDINRADTVQLKKLRGIGSGRARIIINYRNSLGGFYTTDQYSEIYGMDSLSLSELQRYALVITAPEKIKINEISLEQFLRHPYARKNRKLSEALIRYREQHGAFRAREDLEKIVLLTSSFLDLLEPYLEF